MSDRARKRPRGNPGAATERNYRGTPVGGDEPDRRGTQVGGTNSPQRGTEIETELGTGSGNANGTTATREPGGENKATTNRNVRRGKAVGPGKPMLIEIEDVWLGDAFPDTRDVLILSSVRDARGYDSGVQALNWYRTGMKKNQFLEKLADEPGTKVVFYTHEADADEYLITVRIANSSQFDPEVAKKWVATGAGVAGLPAFLGAGPQGQAVVTAVKGTLNVAIELVSKWLSIPASKLSWEMNLNSALESNFRGGWVLLTPDTQKVVMPGNWWTSWGPTTKEVELEILGAQYVVSDDGQLLHRTSRKRVKESWPYVLLKIDGTPSEKLKKWKPVKLTADLTSRFLNAKKGPMDTELVGEFQAFNDLQVVSGIPAIDQKIKAVDALLPKAATAAARKDLESQRKKLTAQRQRAIEDLQDQTLKEALSGTS